MLASRSCTWHCHGRELPPTKSGKSFHRKTSFYGCVINFKPPMCDQLKIILLKELSKLLNECFLLGNGIFRIVVLSLVASFRTI